MHIAEALKENGYVTGAFGLRSSIANHDWKFIDNRGEKSNELFDRRNDPLELENLAEQRPDVAEELHRELWDFESLWSQTALMAGHAQRHETGGTSHERTKE